MIHVLIQSLVLGAFGPLALAQDEAAPVAPSNPSDLINQIQDGTLEAADSASQEGSDVPPEDTVDLTQVGDSVVNRLTQKQIKAMKKVRREKTFLVYSKAVELFFKAVGAQKLDAQASAISGIGDATASLKRAVSNSQASLERLQSAGDTIRETQAEADSALAQAAGDDQKKRVLIQQMAAARNEHIAAELEIPPSEERIEKAVKKVKEIEGKIFVHDRAVNKKRAQEQERQAKAGENGNFDGQIQDAQAQIDANPAEDFALTEASSRAEGQAAIQASLGPREEAIELAAEVREQQADLNGLINARAGTAIQLAEKSRKVAIKALGKDGPEAIFLNQTSLGKLLEENKAADDGISGDIINMLGISAAGTFDLQCNPIGDVTATSYYFFRAASAIFLSAKYYQAQDFKENLRLIARLDDDASDVNNQQVESIERAAATQEELAEAALIKAELGQTTNEMFNFVLAFAQSESDAKEQRISAAEAAVKQAEQEKDSAGEEKDNTLLMGLAAQALSMLFGSKGTSEEAVAAAQIQQGQATQTKGARLVSSGNILAGQALIIEGTNQIAAAQVPKAASIGSFLKENAMSIISALLLLVQLLMAQDKEDKAKDELAKAKAELAAAQIHAHMTCTLSSSEGGEETSFLMTPEGFQNPVKAKMMVEIFNLLMSSAQAQDSNDSSDSNGGALSFGRGSSNPKQALSDFRSERSTEGSLQVAAFPVTEDRLAYLQKVAAAAETTQTQDTLAAAEAVGAAREFQKLAEDVRTKLNSGGQRQINPNTGIEGTETESASGTSCAPGDTTCGQTVNAASAINFGGGLTSGIAGAANGGVLSNANTIVNSEIATSGIGAVNTATRSRIRSLQKNLSEINPGLGKIVKGENSLTPQEIQAISQNIQQAKASRAKALAAAASGSGSSGLANEEFDPGDDEKISAYVPGKSPFGRRSRRKSNRKGYGFDDEDDFAEEGKAEANFDDETKEKKKAVAKTGGRGFSLSGDWDPSQVIMKASLNIFNVITRRYKKTAYPKFLKVKKIKK
jgi:hypothetical protein